MEVWRDDTVEKRQKVVKGKCSFSKETETCTCVTETDKDRQRFCMFVTKCVCEKKREGATEDGGCVLQSNTCV